MNGFISWAQIQMIIFAIPNRGRFAEITIPSLGITHSKQFCFRKPARHEYKCRIGII